eukprot:UC1_evm1s365
MSIPSISRHLLVGALRPADGGRVGVAAVRFQQLQRIRRRHLTESAAVGPWAPGRYRLETFAGLGHAARNAPSRDGQRVSLIPSGTVVVVDKVHVEEEKDSQSEVMWLRVQLNKRDRAWCLAADAKRQYFTSMATECTTSSNFATNSTTTTTTTTAAAAAAAAAAATAATTATSSSSLLAAAAARAIPENSVTQLIPFQEEQEEKDHSISSTSSTTTDPHSTFSSSDVVSLESRRRASGWNAGLESEIDAAAGDEEEKKKKASVAADTEDVVKTDMLGDDNNNNAKKVPSEQDWAVEAANAAAWGAGAHVRVPGRARSFFQESDSAQQLLRQYDRAENIAPSEAVWILSRIAAFYRAGDKRDRTELVRDTKLQNLVKEVRAGVGDLNESELVDVAGALLHLKVATDTPFELRLFQPSVEGYHRDTHRARNIFGRQCRQLAQSLLTAADARDTLATAAVEDSAVLAECFWQWRLSPGTVIEPLSSALLASQGPLQEETTVKLLWFMSQVAPKNEPVFRRLVEAALAQWDVQRASQDPAPPNWRELTEMAFCLGAAGCKTAARPFFARITSTLGDVDGDGLDAVSLHELSVIMWAFARLELRAEDIPGADALYERVIERVNERLEDFNARDVSDIAFAYLKLFLKADGVFTRLPATLRRSILSGPQTSKRLPGRSGGSRSSSGGRGGASPRAVGEQSRGVDFVFKPSNALEPHIEARIRAQENRKERRQMQRIQAIFEASAIEAGDEEIGSTTTAGGDGGGGKQQQQQQQQRDLQPLKRKVDAVKRRKKAEESAKALLHMQTDIESRWEAAVIMVEHLCRTRDTITTKAAASDAEAAATVTVEYNRLVTEVQAAVRPSVNQVTPALSDQLFDDVCKQLVHDGASRAAGEIAAVAQNLGFTTSVPATRMGPKRGLPQFFLARLATRAAEAGLELFPPKDLEPVAEIVLEDLSNNQLQNLSKQLGIRLPSGTQRTNHVQQIASAKPPSLALAALATAQIITAAESTTAS